MYPLTAGVVVETNTIWDDLKSSLKDLPVRIVMEESAIGDLPALIEHVERVRPDMIFLEISALQEPLEPVIRKIRSSASAPAILVLNKTAEPARILEAMRSGAAEYLYPPMQEHLHAALERIASERQSTHQLTRRGGRTVGFVSAKGGCGATTIACHAARELPQVTNSHVLLADLDFDSGMVSFLLKTGARYSIGDAASNTQRLDENYWKALVTNGIPGLEIISAPAPLTARQPILPEQLRFVLNFARTQYDWVVLDLGSGFNSGAAGALEEIDELFIVTTLEVPSLHHVKTGVQRLLDDGYPAQRLHLLVNRAPKHYDITMGELQAMLGLPVHTVIPNDYASLNECYTEGQLLPRTSSLGQHFAALAMKVAGVEPPTKNKKKFAFWAGA